MAIRSGIRKKRWARGGMAALLVMTLLLSACGKASESAGANQGGQSSSSSPSASSGNEGAEAPLELSIMTITPSATPAADDNVIKRAIEKATNSKMSIQWISNNIYGEKLNLTLASGEIPDLIMVNDPFASTFMNMALQGAFWNLSDYIKDYPNLANRIPDIAWETTKLSDGGNYGVPRPRSVDGESFFIIRKDWLDKVGLEVPTTTDELKTVMKAFVQDDPDGNGVADTTALAAYIDPADLGFGGNIGPVLGAIESSFTGVNGNWKWDEATKQMIFTAFLPETEQSLAYLTEAYANKMMPEDLLSLKLTQVRDLFKANKAGIIVDKTGTMKNIYADELKKVAPDFKYTDFYPLANLNGYNPKGGGYNGILAIPKNVPEEKMKRILELLDTWMNEDVYAIQRDGLEGIHYRVENGEKIVDGEKLKADNASDFNHIVNVSDVVWDTKAGTEEETAANELFQKVNEERAKTYAANIAAGLQSETGQLILPELNKKIQDLKAKIILGREPISAWTAFVEATRKDPQVLKMTEEITESYLNRNAK
ncbi:extracellular solute-binding protein [Paenibacillus sp. Leaf72]|uniref:extracellular solute-binding protein n=1 Tax=Paenibacillus sp. Leaf72 TaxID=1736234 RepID=UPI0006F47BDA|nr:extracellular solute-binding protein [Paenibacillus sp. Leaf72]KQO18484.1 ABC transporter substrate-binding protein [Paenibacillus sp. Leaf72]